MPSKKNYNSRFPPARIKKIMQMDEEVGKVAAPVPVIISRVLEMFVEHTLKSASLLAEQSHCRTLLSSHLCQAVASEARLHFLMETVRQHSKAEVPGSQEEVPSAAPALSGLPSARVTGEASLHDDPHDPEVAAGPRGAGRGACSVPGSSGTARGERGRGKPRGRPSKRSCAPPAADPPTPSQGIGVVVKRGRGRPRKNLPPVQTPHPVSALPSPSRDTDPNPPAPSSAGITFSFGGTTPTTPLSGSVGVSIPTLPTTPNPPTGVSFSIPGGVGFSFPSPVTPDPPSDGDKPESLRKVAGVKFPSAGSRGFVAPATSVEGRNVAIGSAVVPKVEVSVGAPSSCQDATSATDSVPTLSGVPSSISAMASSICGVSVSFGSPGPTTQVNKGKNNSTTESSASGVTRPHDLPVAASLAVENSPLGQIKIEVPAYFPKSSGSNSASVESSDAAHYEEKSCVSSKSSRVGEVEENILHAHKKKKGEAFSSEEETMLPKRSNDKFNADDETPVNKKETKNCGRMKENDVGKLCSKSPHSIKSGVSFSNGSSPLAGETKFWRPQAPPVPSLLSCSGMYLTSKVEDNSDEDYDN